MRDSALKRSLVRGYFSAREVVAALRGAVVDPAWRATGIDYETYWAEREPGSVQARFEILAGQLDRGETLLDVGCGDGAMLEYLARERGIRGSGLDISTRAVEAALRRGVDARVQTLADFRRDTTARFDHVVMSEVLEHVPDPESFVRDGWALATRALWLTFPNIAYFPHRLRLLCGRFPVQWVAFPGEHLRFWSVPDFRRWLAALGLPASAWYPTNGVTVAGLHRAWPNLLANQILVRIDRADRPGVEAES